MAELDQIFICNPTDIDFEVHKNGERYILKGKEEGIKPQHLARHMAKHLSDRMMIAEYKEVYLAYAKKNKTLTPHQIDSNLGTQKTMMTMQDTPERRISLYKILRSTMEVDNTIMSYPQFKTKQLKDGTVQYSTIGELSVYNEFVEKAERVPESQEPKPEESKQGEVVPPVPAQA